MNLTILNDGIQRHKDFSPDTFDDIVEITAPFYALYTMLNSQADKITNDNYHLNGSEVDVLATIKLRGGEKYILSPTRINEALLFTSGGITKVLKKLELKGYIKRVQTDHDKRVKLAQLTDKGLEILNNSLIDTISFEKKVFSILNKEEKKRFKDLCMKILKQ